jgi:hypothetical protein
MDILILRLIDALTLFMRRHLRGHLHHLSHQQAHPCCRHQSPLTINRETQSCWWPQWHTPLATLCPLQAWGGNVHKQGCTIAHKGGWHPCPCPLGRQGHHIPLTTLCHLQTRGGECIPLAGCMQPNRGGLIRLPRVDVTLAHYLRGGKAITKLGPSILANLVNSLPPINEHRGE